MHLKNQTVNLEKDFDELGNCFFLFSQTVAITAANGFYEGDREGGRRYRRLAASCIGGEKRLNAERERVRPFKDVNCQCRNSDREKTLTAGDNGAKNPTSLLLCKHERKIFEQEQHGERERELRWPSRKSLCANT